MAGPAVEPGSLQRRQQCSCPVPLGYCASDTHSQMSDWEQQLRNSKLQLEKKDTTLGIGMDTVTSVKCLLIGLLPLVQI